MTTSNAADYLPYVEALRNDELERLEFGHWVPCKATHFNDPPDHYRRRPKPLEFWAGYYGGNIFGLFRDSYEEADKVSVRQGLIKIVHLREVLP